MNYIFIFFYHLLKFLFLIECLYLMFMRVISKLYSCHFFGWFWQQGNAGLTEMNWGSFLPFSLSWKRLWCYFSPSNIGKN